MPDGEFITDLTEHTTTVRALDFSPDSRYLVSVDGASDTFVTGRLIVWDMASAAIVYTIDDAHEGALFAATYSPDGSVIATSGGDNLVRLWDAETGEMLGELAHHNNWVAYLSLYAGWHDAYFRWR